MWFFTNFVKKMSLQAGVFNPHNFNPLCKLENDQLYSVVTDHLGTPKEMVDRYGRIAWRADYSAWGEVRKQSQGKIDCPLRFPGQWLDIESGLYYNRFRYYEPNSARYISADPIKLMGGMNIYGYTYAPTIFSDPFGLVINTTGDRTHITYRGTKGGRPYIGYASAPGNLTGQQVLSRRYSSGFSAEGLDGTPTIVYREHGASLEDSRVAKATARGLEQRNFESAGGLNGTANRQNPVGERNSNRQTYLDAADEHLKEQKRKSEGC